MFLQMFRRNRISSLFQHHYKCLLVSIAIIFSPHVFATAPSITLDQAQIFAIQHNQDLKTARYNVDLAKARLVQAAQLPNPRLELENLNDRLFINEGEYTTRVGISQDFPIAGRIAKQKNVARVDIALAELEIKNAERKLQGEVAALYYQLLVNARRQKQLEQLIDVNHCLARVAQARFKVAEVSEVDSNTANIEWQRLIQQKALLQSIQVALRIQLNNLLGQPSQFTYRLHEKLPTSLPLPSLETLQTRAIQFRPDLQAAILETERTQAELALAHAQRWEDWTVQLGVEQNKQVITGVEPQKPTRSLAVKLSIPLPLFNSNQGAILAAGSAGLQARQKTIALTLTIQNEIVSNYVQLTRVHEQLSQYQNDLITLSKRNVRLAQEAYRQGQISLFDVVQTQRQENDLYNTYLDSLDNYLQTLVKLSMAVGNYQLDKPI